MSQLLQRRGRKVFGLGVKAVEIHYAEAGGITGHVMLFCMLMMFTTAHIRIRQQSYESILVHPPPLRTLLTLRSTPTPLDASFEAPN